MIGVVLVIITVVLQFWGFSQVQGSERELASVYSNIEERPRRPRNGRKEPRVVVRKHPNFRHRADPYSKNDETEDMAYELIQPMQRTWKEPKWKVAKILRQLPAMAKSLIPVFVVEEHYEVLKYWFDAMETGLIPKSGNTLLHIDGHSDAAPPRDMSNVPWFRLPRNHSEVANMMQSNDVFIAGSALAGLINRFIWIWPAWDINEHDEGLKHAIFDIKAGFRTYYPARGDPFRQICVCVQLRPETTWECWDDRPDKTQMAGNVNIDTDPENCKAVFRGVIEQVHEDTALKLLEQGGWINEDENLMLDIDEDYFGCESSIMPLLNAGMTQLNVNKLSVLTSKLLCANDVKGEDLADKVFHTILETVQDFKASLCTAQQPPSKLGTPRSKDCESTLVINKAMQLAMPTITGILEQGATGDLVCKEKSVSLIINTLLRSLFKLNATQLEVLKYVGVCLMTAPTNMMFDAGMLHVCHGFNVPGDLSVNLHTPTPAENEARARLLKRTLSLLPLKPSMVTVCRSVRDGYTPWTYFDYAEKAVFDALKEAFEGVTKKSFHFDENLLGGKNGWPNRHGDL
ncbi:hypothetical protein V1264_011901 [Littorina saxatilis]|uniref:Uncharacterized protein n=2 Tax=Littorina saxatilis TaxID=31220 RepID=A0AAN9GMV9_9CAEN